MEQTQGLLPFGLHYLVIFLGAGLDLGRAWRSQDRGRCRADGLKAGDVAPDAGCLSFQFMHLAGHVGRVDQGQLLAGRGVDVALGDPQVRVGGKVGLAGA